MQSFKTLNHPEQFISNLIILSKENPTLPKALFNEHNVKSEERREKWVIRYKEISLKIQRILF
jgi:hypothetical protein